MPAVENNRELVSHMKEQNEGSKAHNDGFTKERDTQRSEIVAIKGSENLMDKKKKELQQKVNQLEKKIVSLESKNALIIKLIHEKCQTLRLLKKNALEISPWKDPSHCNFLELHHFKFFSFLCMLDKFTESIF